MTDESISQPSMQQQEQRILDETNVVSNDEKEKTEAQEKTVATKLQQATVAVVRASNGLPKIGDGYELYTSYEDYAKFMEQQKIRIIMAMRRLLSNMGCRIKISQFSLEDMEKIIYANDLLIEKIGTSLDKHQAMLMQEIIDKSKLTTGAEALPNVYPPAGSTSMQNRDGGGRYGIAFGNGQTETASPSTSVAPTWSSNSVATKPQHSFYDTIINSDLPFIPKLIVKHNALNVVDKNLRIIDDNPSASCLLESDMFINQKSWLNEDCIDEHPYKNELNHFKIPIKQLIAPEILQDVLNLEETPLTLVDTVEQLERLIKVLNSVDQFAFDVEHHSYRTFLGLTCLIQISTRTNDYLVDPFPIWKSMYLLNEPFSNPRILKVLHGGASDVIWLQRDFGIYVINVFDTSLAMKELRMQRLSLKHLLQDMCDVELNKDLQMADWRIRPLPSNFIEYARMDSHYLLYCYDKLRIRLVQREYGECYANKESTLIKSVFDNSLLLSHKTFGQPRFDPEGYRDILCSRRRFNNRQLCALKQLWKWRDSMAREHDESLHFVLPNHMMLQIAEVLPKEMQGIIACCSPIPPLLKHDLATLHKFITAARDLPLEKIQPSSFITMDSLSAEVDDILNDPLLESNRITQAKAKLEYHFDCTNYKANEEIPSVEARIKLLDDPLNPVQVKADTEIPFFLAMKGKRKLNDPLVDDKIKVARSCVYVEDNLNKSARNKNMTKTMQVFKKISEWATPYESYLCQTKLIREAEQKERGETLNMKQELDEREEGEL